KEWKVGTEEDALGTDALHAVLENEAVILRAGEIEPEVLCCLRRFDGLQVAAPGDAGVSEQDAGARMFLCDLREEQRAAVRIRIPRMHEHNRVMLVRILPDGLIVRACDGIFVRAWMQLDERRLMELLPALEFRDGLS